MKKITTILLLVILIAVSFLSFDTGASAQTDSTCPSIAPYRCNNGSCTNDAALCDQSWGGGLNTNPGGTSSGGAGAGTVTPPSTNNSSFGQQCTGNIRYDAAAAKACADLAEAQGKALGYNIDCNVETRSEQLSLNSTPTGETVNAYYGACTINGVSGFYDLDLVGYTGTGAPVQRYPGKTGYDANDYIFGSNYQRSAGWNILPCDLANTAAGTSGVTAGSANCAIGASNYFGSSNPSSWSPRTPTTTIRRTSTDISANNRSAGTKTGGGTTTGGAGTKTTVSTDLQTFLASIKSIMDKIIADYNKLASGFTYVPTNTTPNTQTPPTNTTDPNYYALGNLTSDKASYCVGETPKYSITGGLGLVGYKVLWTSYKDNVITQEVDADYGFKMVAQGTGSAWSDYGWTWNSGHIGTWKKQANVGGTLKSVSFDVKACTAPTTVSCSPKSTRWFNTYSVIPNLTASGGSGSYSWTATGSTKVSGAGTQFSTSYSQNGTYQITVSDGTNTDTCTVIVSPNLPLAINR